MTVGLVIVSHSAALAAGVRELAAQMAPEVTIAVAGGTDDGGVGTSFDLVTAALADADSGDGVVVLYDLGSALLTTETALEFSDPDAAGRITVVDAPLVEGAVAAAVAAQSGTDLASVATAARRAGASWDGSGETGTDPAPDTAGAVRRTATVADADGVHARPASLLAREAGRWPGATVRLGRPGESPVPVTDVLQLIGLGLRQGETVEFTAGGDGSEDAAATLARMIDAGLD
ncbi:dihydroxyacetone kinase phosphoryl donor subunit DhaM [Nakamurella deserti]|uniref:dihydroxyacetone kinase phosphoryl donor subunit DhaM n=1 Tax=Nakamurella deserti TaxID=2164074 RepID=UPI000DBE4BD5|nr:dihydroxyacetone kinase phosphoryl donor subunit DhaM [Nakamurella deserti]